MVEWSHLWVELLSMYLAEWRADHLFDENVLPHLEHGWIIVDLDFGSEFVSPSSSPMQTLPWASKDFCSSIWNCCYPAKDGGPKLYYGAKPPPHCQFTTVSQFLVRDFNPADFALETLVSNEDFFHSAAVPRFGDFFLEQPLSSLDSECPREGVIHLENEFGRFWQFRVPFDSKMIWEKNILPAYCTVIALITPSGHSPLKALSNELSELVEEVQDIFGQGVESSWESIFKAV